MRYADRGHIQWKPQFVQLRQPQRYSYIRASDPYTAQQSRGRCRPRVCRLFMLTRSMAHNRVRFAPNSLPTAGLSVQIYGKTKSRSGVLLWLGSAVRFGTVAHVREARPDEAIKESYRIRITGARGKTSLVQLVVGRTMAILGCEPGRWTSERRLRIGPITFHGWQPSGAAELHQRNSPPSRF